MSSQRPEGRMYWADIPVAIGLGGADTRACMEKQCHPQIGVCGAMAILGTLGVALKNDEGGSAERSFLMFPDFIAPALPRFWRQPQTLMEKLIG